MTSSIIAPPPLPEGPAAARADAVMDAMVVAWSRVSGQMDVCAMETRVAGEGRGAGEGGA